MHLHPVLAHVPVVLSYTTPAASMISPTDLSKAGTLTLMDAKATFQMASPYFCEKSLG